MGLRVRRWVIEWLLDASRRSGGAWVRKVSAAEERYGPDSEHARHARARVAHFSGIAARAELALTRLKVEDKT